MSNKAEQFARFLREQIFLLKNRTIMSWCHLLDKLPVDNRTYFLESGSALQILKMMALRCLTNLYILCDGLTVNSVSN